MEKYKIYFFVFILFISIIPLIYLYFGFSFLSCQFIRIGLIGFLLVSVLTAFFLISFNSSCDNRFQAILWNIKNKIKSKQQNEMEDNIIFLRACFYVLPFLIPFFLLLLYFSLDFNYDTKISTQNHLKIASVVIIQIIGLVVTCLFDKKRALALNNFIKETDNSRS